MSDTSAKPTVPEVLPLVRAFYAMPGNSVGGLLHIVLDDGNVDDADVRFCLNEAEKEGDKDATELARLLLQMSKTQRRKLYMTRGRKEPLPGPAPLVQPYYTP